MVEGSAGTRKRGRPPGTGVVARLRAQLLTGEKLEALVNKTYEMALAGDPASVRIILDRILPPLRAQAAPVRIALPDGTLTDQAKAVLAAAASGQLAPDVAAELIRAVAGVAGVVQTDELRRQVEALLAEDQGQDLA